MNAATLPPLVRTIQFIRDAARAPQTEWPSYARAVDNLPRVMVSEAGDVAAMLASSARGIVRQMHRIEQEGVAEMTEALKKLADVLQIQLNAHGKAPFYLDKG